MGCSTGDRACESDELPAHAVEFKSGFWLARTEVTRAQYRKLPDAARSLAGENLPMTELSWAEAKAYCVSIGGRLPSEAEWEYAARGGTTVRYYDSLPAVAWFADNSDEQLHPVGIKPPNAFGLYDMLGNASEWSAIASTTGTKTQTTQRPSKSRWRAMPPAWRAAARGSPTPTA